MAEPVILDLVTPERVAPEDEGGPVPQVEEGGSPTCLPVKVGIRVIEAFDWSPKEELSAGQLPSFLNVKYWTTDALSKPVEGSEGKVLDPNEFVVSFWDKSEDVKPIKRLFKKVEADVNILAIFAHSAPYHADDHNIGKNDPRQYLSLGDGDEFYVSIKAVANVLMESTGKIRDKYDVIFLGCCQGDKLAGLIKKAVLSSGVLVYFGAEEGEDDGAAGGLISEFWECFLENCKQYSTKGEQPNWKDVFETSYVETGDQYLAPKGQHDVRVPGPEQDFEYMECILDKSVQNAMKDPSFVEHYTFAGDLHALMDGVDLVTDDLKARRKAHIAEKQAVADRQHRGGRKAGSPGRAKGKRGRV